MLIEALESRLLFASGTILFIRGATRSGGFLEGVDAATRDEQLADINNHSTSSGNAGWGTLAQTLQSAGYAVQQMTEAKEPGAPSSGFIQGRAIRLENLDLSQFSAIVFGSNNARYTAASVRALQNYVNAGGAALFISDANFGANWRDAADSDQQLLAPYGLIVNQDNASAAKSLTRAGGDFADPAHPLVNGIDSFNAEGISSFTVPAAPPAGVTVDRVVAASGKVRVNNGVDSTSQFQGTLRSATDRDASMVALTSGAGRIVAFGDRNTFFNDNGVGTDITQLQNRQLAINFFNWLTDHTPPVMSSISVQDGSPRTLTVTFNDLLLDGTLTRGDILLRNSNSGAPIDSRYWSFSLDNSGAQTRLVSHIKGAVLPGLYQIRINPRKYADDAGNVNRTRQIKMFTIGVVPHGMALQSVFERPVLTSASAPDAIRAADDLFANSPIL
jgi:hypothetical protein